MTELLPVVVVSLLLAALSDFSFSRILSKHANRQMEKLSFFITCTILILFVGLRTQYNDTTAYAYSYNMLIQHESTYYTNTMDWKLGANPGFNLVNTVLVYLGVSAQSFLMFYASITVGCYLWFLRKYSTNFFGSLFLFFTLGCYTFTLAAIKQCVAMALCLVGTDRAIRGKHISFILWILVAASFHPYALLYLVVPFMMFRPWSGKSIVLLGCFAVGGVLLEELLGTLINITTMLGEEYTIESFTSDGVNPFRLAVCAVPLLLALITRRVIYIKNNRIRNLFVNLSILNTEIMFIALFGTANYFARLANYFLIFQTLSIPWLLSHFDKESQKLMNTGAALGYSVYFYYANVINQHFDALYSGISLVEYLKTIF